MNATDIEWADFTWNPIVGCTHGCEFCYARRLMRRRKPGTRRGADGVIEHYGCQQCFDFTPHLHPERLGQPAEVKSSSRIIFAGSVTDLWDPQVQPEWRAQVFAAMNAAPWHHYVLLTKRPDLINRYELWAGTYRLANDNAGPGGLWLGVSITRDADWWRVVRLVEIAGGDCPHPVIVSFEPLLGPITHEIPPCISWVIVGAQTGPGAVAPGAEWLAELSYMTDALRIPLFQKDNLAATLAPRSLRQEWPQWMMEETGGVAARGRLSSGLQ